MDVVHDGTLTHRVMISSDQYRGTDVDAGLYFCGKNCRYGKNMADVRSRAPVTCLLCLARGP